MTRWFSAELEGSYVGVPNAKGPARGSRRHQLRVYRAALRDLRWLDPPEALEARGSGDAVVPVGPESASAVTELGPHTPRHDAPVPVESHSATAVATLGPNIEPVLRQVRVDYAHVAGVRGPGTWYEGPVFDLVIHSVRLTHATEHEGRAYGRIVGSAVGWLELPPEPVQPDVRVSEVVAAPPEPLSAVVYRQPTAAGAESGTSTERESAVGRDTTPERDTTAGRVAAAAATARVRSRPPPEFDAEPEIGEAPGETAAHASTPSPFLLPLTLAVVVVGLGLFIACGAGTMGLWALFMLPTLLARRLFVGVLRDGGFLRGFGYACIAVQGLCVSQLVSSAWSSGCPQISLLPMLGVIAVLFPAGLLPSIIPLSCNALGLALVLATFCHAPATACGNEQRVTLAPTSSKSRSAPALTGWKTATFRLDRRAYRW